MLGYLSAVKCGEKRFSRYDRQWRFQIGKQIALIKLENVEKRFKNNIPGPDWVNISMKPNNLTKDMTSNTKQERAVIDKSFTNKIWIG